MKLYFIAVLPDAALQDRIKEIKEEISEKFNASHALKLPAHITLQIPFKASEEEEERLIEALETFAGREHAFSLQLLNFGAFAPRVIYISIKNPEPVKELQHRLQNVMKDYLGIQKQGTRSAFHPHVTVATRDLNRVSFEKAWEEFQKRDFNDTFHVDILVLFKHNGKTWDIHREFKMNSQHPE